MKNLLFITVLGWAFISCDTHVTSPSDDENEPPSGHNNPSDSIMSGLEDFVKKDSSVRSLKDFFKYVERNKAKWNTLGIDSSNISMVLKLKKVIIDQKNPSVLFEKSNSGHYFFEFVPTEGDLRRDLFYWYSKTYPDEWIVGLERVGSKN